MILTGDFLRNHYLEALKAKSALESELAAIKAELNVTDEDLIRNFAKEVKYLDDLKQVPINDMLKIKYVQALIQHAQFE